MFGDLKSAAGVKALNEFLAEHSYIEGYVPSQADTAVFEALAGAPKADTPHALRWYNHVKSFGAGMKQFAKASKNAADYTTGAAAAAAASNDDDDDVDLFGSDDEEETEACPISEQPYSILDQILSTLSLEDLSSLSLTCKFFYDTVGEFLRHECCPRKLLDGFQQFVNTNSRLLTQGEKQLVDTLQDQLSTDLSLSRQGMYRLLHDMHYKETVYRFSAVEEIKEKLGFYLTAWDVSLGRKVGRWFRHFNYIYENVVPGVYTAAMVIKLREVNLEWRSPRWDMTQWSLRWPEKKDGGGERIIEVDCWRCVVKEQTHLGEMIGKGLRVEWEEVNCKKTRWIKVEMPRITVEEEGNIELQLWDDQCPYWEEGFVVDVVELRKLN